MKVSIIIPVYNEAKTIQRIVDVVRVASFGFEAQREIIVIDDGSADGTYEALKSIKGIKVLHFERNQGKGAALKAGFGQASGDFVIIQDADL